MDFDLNSSDFEFPSDTGLSKLSSPLSFKVPESRDWALDEFMQTLSSKPCMEADNLTSFKQYIPVQQGDDDFNCGLPKLSLPFFEEKDLLTQFAQHFHDLERKELLDILKGGFSLVQNDIQTNSNASPFASAHPDISWFDEAFDHGHHTNVIDDLGDIEFKRATGFSPFATATQHQPAVREIIEQDAMPPMEIHKPLPALPILPITDDACAAETTHKKKKGLKHKLKSKLIKSFTPTTTNKKNFLANTKKFITKIFPSKNATQ
ncbi:hypothetical protein MFLAVUS_001569 [Mucor flavus]|uniref:Uncharacterized protein n=1 Tax=Mucor flavus TaxID=439312 RepID=A0ABP9YMU0_9FUNG